MAEFRFCPQCATPLAWHSQMEDGGEQMRLRCPACDFVHWNNPTPVLAGIVQVGVVKVSFGAEKLLDNARTVIASVVRAKPSSAKGQHIRTVYVSSTMGPGIEIDTAHIDERTKN